MIVLPLPDPLGWKLGQDCRATGQAWRLTDPVDEPTELFWRVMLFAWKQTG